MVQLTKHEAKMIFQVELLEAANTNENRPMWQRRGNEERT